jgi:transposase
MDRQTLRDWVHRYNAGGLAGLRDRPPPGAPRRLTAEQEAEVAELVEAGPTLAEHKVVRWRRADLAGLIEARWGVRLHERTVGKLLGRLGFRRLVPRPRHPEYDAGAQASFRPRSLPS